MHESYNIFINKSIAGLIIGLFLISALPAYGSISADPEYKKQTQVYSQINLPDAWNFTTGSPEVVVAVLDTGIDINHPDLKNNIWVNKYEVPDNGFDDDRNGYIDDVNGWNFVEKNNDVIGSEEGTFFGDDVISHGTVITGLIGAAGDNNLFGAGVNWRVRIMPVRTIDNYGSGSYDDIAKAIDYAAFNGADIISLSFVGYADDAGLYEALRRAYAKNILIVVAAGNNRADGTGFLEKNELYPVCYREYADENWLLGVTAVDKTDRLSAFANFGNCVDIAAPGENLYSTAMRTNGENGTGFIGPWSGTSFATPLVAGAAALLKSLQPDWTAKKLIATLLASADNIDKMNPKLLGLFGYGRLNIGAAVKMAIDEINLNGPFANVCYKSDNYIYCQSLSSNKSWQIAGFKNKIIILDSSDSELIAAMIKEGNNYVIKIIKKNGEIVSSWTLPQGIIFDLVKVASLKNEKQVYATGYDAKNDRTRIIASSIGGKQVSSWWVTGRVDSFTVDKNGNIFIAGIKNGKLTVEEFNALGNFIRKIEMGVATRVDDMSVERYVDSENDQLTIIYRRGLAAYRSMVYLESGSILRERLSDTGEKWSLISQDYDSDGLIDLMPYNGGGGVFKIISGKGKTLKNVQLPRLK